MNYKLYLNHNNLNNKVKSSIGSESINMDKAEFIGNDIVISETKSIPFYLDAKIEDLRLFSL